MKLKLTKNFEKQEIDYIRYYLSAIDFADKITVYPKSIDEFLTRLSYGKPQDLDREPILGQEEKKGLAIKFINCIMEDEQAFINLVMAESSMLYNISRYPLLSSMHKKSR